MEAEENTYTEEMLIDLIRLRSAEQAMDEALKMIGHPEIQESLINAIADYCGAMMIGTVHAMDADHAEALAKATQPSAN